ncbi:MAG: hypothetical protein R2712_06325 [Vicinamibacterales bacterium]
MSLYAALAQASPHADPASRLGRLPLGAAWVSVEHVRGWLFGGFPWILGNTMVTLLLVAQLASLGGVYALSVFVALVNAGFAVMVVSPARRRAGVSRPRWPAWGSCPCGEAPVPLGRHAGAGRTPVRVGIVQANIRQEDKWNAPARVTSSIAT